MPLETFPRGKRNILYLRGTVQGVPVYESTGTSDPEIAEAIRIKRENEILQRHVFGTRATVTFIEAANAYIGYGGKKGGAANNRKHIGVIKIDGSRTLLLKKLGDRKLDSIVQADFDAAADEFYPGTKASTRIRHIYSPLKAVLNYGAKQGWCAPPMIVCPHVTPPVTRYSSAERMQTLMPFLNPNLRRFVIVLMITGARLSEVLRIEWKDISLSARTLAYWKTKTVQREVHITDHLLIELALIPEAERQGELFHWEDKCSPGRALKRACKNAGVDYLSSHQQGRHTYAMWMMKYGKANLRELMAAGGWTSVQSVIRYLHAEATEAGKKAESFPDIFGAKLSKSAGKSETCTDSISEIRAKSVQATPAKRLKA